MRNAPIGKLKSGNRLSGQVMRAAHRACVEGLEDRTLFSFTLPASYGVGAAPHGIAVADLNGDGRKDLAVANSAAAGSVSVLLGNGDGSFQAKTDYAATAYAYDVKSADFNGDGFADLVVIGSSTSPGSILLGNGNGTFAAPLSLVTAANTHTVVVGDFNHDGRTDIATVSTSTVSLLLGNGDGTFQPRTDTIISYSPNGLVAADFNRDGNLDLAIPNTVSTGTVSVMMGNGDGSFRPVASYAAFSAPTAIAVGDFNHDSYPDLVVPNSYTSSAITVLIGNGDGSFKAPITYNIPSAPFDVEVGDFNNDGNIDVAEKSGGSYEVQLGRGDGTLYAPTLYTAPAGPSDTEAVGDFNGDGSDDLVSPTYTGSVAVLVNNANDRASLSTAVGFVATAPATITANAAVPMTVSAVDVNGVTVSDFLGTVYFSSSDTQMRSPTGSYTFTAADAGTHTFIKAVTLGTVGTQTVQASAPFMAASTNTIVVTPAITRLTLTAPITTVAGSTVAVTVSATDALGNIGTNYTGTIALNTSDAQAGAATTYTFTAADAGTHTFNLTLKTAGNTWVSAADSAAFLNGYSYVAVSPSTVASLTVVGGAGAIGLSRQVVVAAKDQYGNLATGYTGTLHFTSSDPIAILPADSVLMNGSGSFPVTLLTVGTQTITVTDTANPSLTGIDQGILAAPAAPSSFTVNGLSAAVAGINQTFTVTVKDTLGQIANGYVGTVYFSSSDYQAALPVSYAFTAADAGVHKFSLALKTAGTQSVFANDWATYGFTGSQSGIAVTSAAAAKLTLTGPARTAAGASQPVTVTVRDAYGNLASSYKGKVKFSSSDVQAVLPVDYQFTTTDAGVHTFQVTLKTAQLQSITATDVSNTTIAGSITGIDVLAGAATQFAMVVPSAIAVNTAFTLKVSALDAFGNKVKNYAGTIHFGNTAGMVGMPADYTFSPSLDAGVHTFNVTLSTAGTQTLSIVDTLNPLLQSSLSVTVGTKTTTSGGGGGGSGKTV